MNKRIVLGFLLATLWAPRPDAQAGRVSAVENTIRKYAQEFASHWNARALDKVLDFYAPDAVVLAANQEAVSGSEAIRAFFKGLMDAGATDLALEVLRVEHAGNLAYERGHYKFAMPREQIQDRGKYVVVWKRQPRGEWRIAVDSFSTDLPAQPISPLASLYKRLGGYDAIAAVTDDFLGRLLADPQQSRFFQGVSTESRSRIRQLAVDQLCAATGGPCIYIGRSMKASHAGLGISESDWQATVKHLVATLDKFKVPEKEKGEVLTAIGSLKQDIVEK